MRKLNWDKELKKVQKRGLYNPKVRVFSIIAIAVLTLGIGLTFSAFSYSSGDSQAFNSTVTKKVNITVKTTNGYPSTLAGKILTDNEVKENPNFSSSHTDKGLYVQKGDNTKSVDGKPTYYFRGLVTNNYMSFAGLMWRIVRINEDGTIRLINNGGLTPIVYSTNESTNYVGSEVEKSINTWYDTLSSDNKNYLAKGSFCNDVTNTATSRYNANATFVCPSGGNSLNLFVGAPSADEYIYSGASYNTPSKSALGNTNWSWTMTAASNNVVLLAAHTSNANNFGVNTNSGEINKYGRNPRQVINLKAEALYKSGEGTSSSPYVVEGLASTADTYTKESRYNKATDINVYPYGGYTYESVSCDNGQTATYDSNSKKLTISAKKDTTCTVKFKQKQKQKLSAAILANNTLKTTTPDFSKGEPPVSGTNTGSGLYKTMDDDGESYYFRGTIENNYVKFANKDWRIIRVNGDETIRIITSEAIGDSKFNELEEVKYVGYTYDNENICTIDNPCTTNSGKSSVIKTYLESWYNTNLKSFDSNISLSSFCNDTSSGKGQSTQGGYGSSLRMGKGSPILTCPDTDKNYGGYYSLKIGLINNDELLMSGLNYLNASNLGHYLLFEGDEWTISPAVEFQNYAFMTNISNGFFDGSDVDNLKKVRPVINLKSDVTISSGNGTKDNPYVIG